MLTEWTVSNFKSIGRPTTLEFAPLTIFCGTNSSGKSTIIQSLLLISQTLASKIGSRSVVLNGHLTKLGQFDDLKSFGIAANEISIGWRCQPLGKLEGFQRFQANEPVMATSRGVYRPPDGEDLYALNCNISFAAGGTGPEHDLQQMQPNLTDVTLERYSKDSKTPRSKVSAHRIGPDAQVKSKLKSISVPEIESDELRDTLYYDVEVDADSHEEITDEYPSARVIGCSLRHFLPWRVTLRIDPVREFANYVWVELSEGKPARARVRLPPDIVLNASIVELLRRRLPDDLAAIMLGPHALPGMMDGNYTLRDWRNGRRALDHDQRLKLRHAMLNLEVDVFAAIKAEGLPDYSVEQLRMPRELLDSVTYLDSYFTRYVRYLGPLRDEPKALYPMATSMDPADVGTKGENTAAVLDLHRKRRVVFLPPRCFRSANVEVAPTRVPLGEAVLEWLRYLGVADEVTTKDRGKLGHELRVAAADTRSHHDLTHVGVGVSQVLPILVACLLAPSDTVLVIEQPELHLHPRVQTLLGDFFLGMAMLGKQCILETHSEHIINRLRLRIASASNSSLGDLTKIYFAEKQDGFSGYRAVPINEYGAIVAWPAGFFDESQREAEALLRAGAAKRKRSTPSK